MNGIQESLMSIDEWLEQATYDEVVDAISVFRNSAKVNDVLGGKLMNDVRSQRETARKEMP
jgi:hypothetical protein